MKLFKTTQGILAQSDPQGSFHNVPTTDWDRLLTDPGLYEMVERSLSARAVPTPRTEEILAPIGAQEVWAAGVTYYRSRTARIEESKVAGGGTFYDRVYAAERPELFFKSAGWRVVGSGAPVRIRQDASWSVPEPELTLVIAPTGRLIGYTIGNDMSSRDIEGENPLYLPQAKVYNSSCAIGPCILLAAPNAEPLTKSTSIAIEIHRGAALAFSGRTTLTELKRDPLSLIEYLYRELDFPNGAMLMTGTGVVPPDDFTLASGDEISITIDGIGSLQNRVG
ncbi:MAG: fumarylacetoacetate hydrolase family protein [Acidobacteriaceae bacterium]